MKSLLFLVALVFTNLEWCCFQAPRFLPIISIDCRFFVFPSAVLTELAGRLFLNRAVSGSLWLCCHPVNIQSDPVDSFHWAADFARIK